MRDAGYVPTLGMLRALAGASGADAFDQLRCRLRGLARGTGEVTEAGRQCIRNEIRRRESLDA